MHMPGGCWHILRQKFGKASIRRRNPPGQGRGYRAARGVLTNCFDQARCLHQCRGKRYPSKGLILASKKKRPQPEDWGLRAEMSGLFIILTRSDKYSNLIRKFSTILIAKYLYFGL